MAHSSKLGLGTVQFGVPYGISNKAGQTTSDEVARILEVAVANHISVIDTASAYGTAESVLGDHNTGSFGIISKFMPVAEAGKIEAQLKESLSKLRQQSLYGYLAHKPLDLLEAPDDWNALQALKREGLIQKVGFSVNEISELDRLRDAGFVPDLVQVPFNYFDRRFSKQLLALKARGCEIHTRSAFLQGLFFTNTNELPAFFDVVKPLIASLQGSIQNLPGSLLRFVVDQPFIDKVIIGVENAGQLTGNINDLEMATVLPDLSITIPENIVKPYTWPKS